MTPKSKKTIFPKVSFRRFSEKEKVRETIGQTPGKLVYTGHKAPEKTQVELITFNETEVEQKSIEDINEIKINGVNKTISWLNVAGLNNLDLIQSIGEKFQLHPLLLEDVLHVDQRPKMEDFGDHIFFTIKMFHNVSEKGIDYEHLSFVLGKDWVISFQELPEDQFDIIRERLITAYGKIRQRGADYLFYRFIDIIVDHYFLILDRVAEKLEQIEEEVMEKPSNKTLQNLQYSRKELIHLRRSIYPLRESINGLIKGESSLIKKETHRYLMDAYDHCIQVIESLDTYRELLNGVMDLYMNSASNRMNEIMKVLTIMSTIFIPLTFIAGIYGMNFEHMPELSLSYAYPLIWTLMVSIVIGMLIIFRRKKWL